MRTTGSVALATVIVIAGISTSGCGTGPTNAVKPLADSPMPSASPPQKHYAHGTGHLRMTVTPTRGGVGTEVTVRATGCGDPDGQNHAVSFNPGFRNTMQAAQAHYRQGVIPSVLIGQTLTARYRITAEDGAAAAHAESPPSRFYVQCSDDLGDAPFLITR
jgi:hypothetical protein